MTTVANNRIEILEKQIASLAWLFTGRPKGKQVVNDTKRIEGKIQIGKLCLEMKEELRKEGKISYRRWANDRKYPDTSIDAYIKLYEDELKKQPRIFLSCSGKEYTLPVTVSMETYTFLKDHQDQEIAECIVQMILEAAFPLDIPTKEKVEIVAEHLEIERDERIKQEEELAKQQEELKKQREEEEKRLQPVLGVLPSSSGYYTEIVRPNNRVRKELEPYTLLKHPTLEGVYAIRRPSDAFPKRAWDTGRRFTVTLNGQHLYIGWMVQSHGTESLGSTAKDEDVDYDLNNEGDIYGSDLTLRVCTPEQIERSYAINEAWIRFDGRKVTDNTQHFHFVAPSRSELIKYFKQQSRKMKNMLRPDGKVGYQSYEVVDDKRPTMEELFPSTIHAAGRASFAIQSAYRERERYLNNVRDM